MPWMPADGEGAGGQGIHHILTHQSSCSSRDTKLRSLARPHSQAWRWGEMKAAVCIHILFRCIVKQYIITLAFSGHFASNMIKPSISIVQWMFYFALFHSFALCRHAHLLCQASKMKRTIYHQTWALTCQIIQYKCVLSPICFFFFTICPDIAGWNTLNLATTAKHLHPFDPIPPAALMKWDQI